MDKIARSFVFNVVLLLGACGAIADESPSSLHRISLLPHQAGICDIIFAGTILSTNFTVQSPAYRYLKSPAAEFAVDDVLWGTLASSNIVVGSVYPSDGDDFMAGERYLVCAFTNNWWANTSRDDRVYNRLWNYLSVTGAPPGNAVLDGYRTIYPHYSVIPFSQINYGGTNRWDATRALVTNLVHIARVRRDDELMRKTIKTILNDRQNTNGLPTRVIRQLAYYEGLCYGWEDRTP